MGKEEEEEIDHFSRVLIWHGRATRHGAPVPQCCQRATNPNGGIVVLYGTVRPCQYFDH